MIRKLIALNQRHKGRLFSQQIAGELTKTLTQTGLSLDLSVLNKMFEEELDSSITSREKIVYDIINSRRDIDNDVTLDDLLKSDVGESESNRDLSIASH
jgi:hypothetical protein